MTEHLWSGRALEVEEPNVGCPSLTPYLLEGAGPHPAIIVIPGGGYRARAAHEGEPIAKWLNSIGVAAFVLNYRVAPFQYPTQLQDAQRAIRLVRHRSEEWHVDPTRVGVLGFSAGGHLAATVGTHFDEGDPAANDPIEQFSCRPDLLVLCYAVITMGTHTHEGSKTALLGERQTNQELVKLLSNELQVTQETPPTFLWHTASDLAVPVENSLHFAAALSRQGVPFEVHVYEQGPHGLGMAPGYPGAGTWTAICKTWLERRRFIGNPLTLDVFSTLGELRNNERALSVLNKYIPHFIANPGIPFAEGLPLRSLATYFSLDEKQLLAIEAELASIV